MLKRLHEMGIAAVVLYYIGIFVPALDDSLVSAADELNLPLICMPPDRFDFRYGEMINDVMCAIFQNRDVANGFPLELSAPAQPLAQLPLCPWRNALLSYLHGRKRSFCELCPLNNYDDLVKTLSVYLLDADHSMKQTSALMFVHQNTVKYHINRIRKCFDCDISKMPEASALYYAVALSRLMER